MEKKLWYRPTVIPLSGVTIPGMSVKESIREVVNSSLGPANTGLISTLKFLIFREWYPSWPKKIIPPHMDCLSCGHEFYLPVSNPSKTFKCSHCNYEHYLSDYMGIAEISDNFSRESTVSNLRNVIETLILFDFLRRYRNNPSELEKTLFLKDGPLLLRAQLARLVEPIRDFLCFLRDRSVQVNIVGIEKNGGMVELVDEFKNSLPKIGDYFIPSVKFLVEDISGTQLANNYRNRVSYGAKVAIRLGKRHVVVIHIPTGEFLMEPDSQDLIGFEDSVRVLSNVLSQRYENALVPLVLINSMVSISRRPSNKVLEKFVDEHI